MFGLLWFSVGVSLGDSILVFFSLYKLKRYRNGRLIFSRTHYSRSVQFLLSILWNFCYLCISDMVSEQFGSEKWFWSTLILVLSHRFVWIVWSRSWCFHLGVHLIDWFVILWFWFRSSTRLIGFPFYSNSVRSINWFCKGIWKEWFDFSEIWWF